MTVGLDMGVFLQIFGRKQPFYAILRALLDGRLVLALCIVQAHPAGPEAARLRSQARANFLSAIFS